MNHTPTPWTKESDDIMDADWCCVAKLYATYVNGEPMKDANAEFIVRACNSHDAMVEALEAMYLQMSHFESAWEEAGVVDLYGDAMAKAIAALGQAKGGKP